VWVLLLCVSVDVYEYLIYVCVTAAT